MDWLQIGSVVLIIALLIFLFPRAKYMLQNSPKAGEGDWQAFLLPIVLVVLFVAGLMHMVKP